MNSVTIPEDSVLRIQIAQRRNGSSSEERGREKERAAGTHRRHVREMLRSRPPIGMPCDTSEDMADVVEGEVPLAPALSAANGGLASIASWILRIHIDAIDALPAT